MSEVTVVTRAELFKLVRRPAAWVLLAAASCSTWSSAT